MLRDGRELRHRRARQLKAFAERRVPGCCSAPAGWSGWTALAGDQASAVPSEVDIFSFSARCARPARRSPRRPLRASRIGVARDRHVLVNNAGLSRGLAKLQEDDPQNWEEMIDTNVKGLLYVTRAIVPGMLARGRGHVINMGSTAGHQTYANGAVYCASKAAERAITEGLRIDLIGTPVRTTSIDPGMVETEFASVRFRGDQDRAAKVYQNITPLQPEDVADAILWTATRPPHVNIHTVVMTTIDQANSTVFHRHS